MTNYNHFVPLLLISLSLLKGSFAIAPLIPPTTTQTICVAASTTAWGSPSSGTFTAISTGIPPTGFTSTGPIPTAIPASPPTASPVAVDPPPTVGLPTSVDGSPGSLPPSGPSSGSHTPVPIPDIPTSMPKPIPYATATYTPHATTDQNNATIVYVPAPSATMTDGTWCDFVDVVPVPLLAAAPTTTGSLQSSQTNATGTTTAPATTSTTNGAASSKIASNPTGWFFMAACILAAGAF